MYRVINIRGYHDASILEHANVILGLLKIYLNKGSDNEGEEEDVEDEGPEK